MMTPTLGVALITKNAAARLDECLSSLVFADRVVLLDSGSTDTTLAIARAHGVEIYQSADWPGFGIQKNRAVALLDTDWIFLIDADEVVTPKLAASIQAALAAPQAEVYELNRLSSFCGHWMRHSGWYPDWIARLFKRGSARFSEDLVHERLRFTCPSARLAGALLHYSYENYSDVLRKLEQYSSLGATQRIARGETGDLGKAIARGSWAFLRTYFLRLGFLDGRAGLIVAIFNAETVYYRILKMQLVQPPPHRTSRSRAAAAR
ncbi:MAG: glycosyltransferase family 2 protein [Candidatus Competibacteraceae bacterium]